MTRTLVAYASRHGSTEQVARAIAARLREAGHHVDVRAAGVVTDIAAYNVIVLGGSLYMGRWHRDARAFVCRHRAALDEHPPFVFALGPKTLDPVEVKRSRDQLLGALARLECEPRSAAIFGGVVDPATLHFPLNRMEKTDARDWKEIERWASSIADEHASSLAAQ